MRTMSYKTKGISGTINPLPSIHELELARMKSTPRRSRILRSGKTIATGEPMHLHEAYNRDTK